jgi:hypothetical protein
MIGIFLWCSKKRTIIMIVILFDFQHFWAHKFFRKTFCTWYFSCRRICVSTCHCWIFLFSQKIDDHIYYSCGLTNLGSLKKVCQLMFIDLLLSLILSNLFLLSHFEVSTSGHLINYRFWFLVYNFHQDDDDWITWVPRNVFL